MSPLESAKKAVARLLSRRPEVVAAYVFGSVVTGRLRPTSDIDVAVLVDAKCMKRLPLQYRLDLIVDLGSALRRNDVDVVILNQAPPALAQNVISKGKLVFERSRSARVAFQVRTLNLFLDEEPLHQVHLQYMKRRYLKGKRRG